MNTPVESLERDPPVAIASGSGLQALSLILPILKCAVCPACLSLWGTMFASARLGVFEDERAHALALLSAVIVDFAILAASMRHHGSRRPLVVCAVGAVLALGGHVAGEAVEFAGLAVLVGAGVSNFFLLRAHRHRASGCCSREVIDGRGRDSCAL